ncbi:MAG: hypothetical protein WCP39_05885, partial [Chlamydiota bacterium]
SLSGVGGLKFGGWFCKKTSLESSKIGKYFGCYLDVSYDSLRYHVQKNNTPITYTEGDLGPAEGISYTKFSAKGFSLVAPACLAAVRFGVCPSEKNPFGMIQPYVALGPAFFIVRQKGTLSVDAHSADGTNLSVLLLTDKKMVSKRKTAFTAALAVDAGIRWMVLENFSVDTFFKYRFAKPSFHIHNEMNFHPTLHLYSVHLGGAYHF